MSNAQNSFKESMAELGVMAVIGGIAITIAISAHSIFNSSSELLKTLDTDTKPEFNTASGQNPTNMSCSITIKTCDSTNNSVLEKNID